jgi:Tol biopolymer transport system component
MKIGSVLAAALAAALVACGGGERKEPPLARVVLTPQAGSYGDSGESPDGSRLAYTRYDGRKNQLWIAAADGSNARQLFAAAAGLEEVGWSSDGERLVFWAAQTGPPDIYTVPTAGGPAAQLTSDPTIEGSPRFSPDGAQILYHSNRSGTGFDVWRMSAAGGPSTRLTSSAEDEWGLWDPKGGRIAVTACERGACTISLLGLDGETLRKLTSEGFEGAEDWSPDGSLLAYTSWRSGLSDIWAVPADGGEPRQLTNDIRADWRPRYSPDGRWLAFHSERGGQDDVWLMPATGGDASRVTDDPAEESGLEWTRDGKGLTFVSSDQVSHLFVVPLAGGASRQLTSGHEDHWRGRISPDGRFVLYNGERGGGDDLFIVPVGGGEERGLATGAVDEYAAEWSPDGTRIAFVSTAGGHAAVQVMPAAGGERVRVSPEGADASDPTWSPDGGTVAFLSGGRLMTVLATGGTAKPVSDQEVRRFWWSPDGRAFLLSSSLTKGQEALALFTIPAAGGEPRRLTEGMSAAVSGRWSPDGTKIAVVANASPPGEVVNLEIFVMDAEGSNRRRLTDHPDIDGDPYWSPDGSEVLFSTNRNGNSDIAAVPVEGGAVRMVVESPLDERIDDISRDGINLVYFGNSPNNQLVRVDVGPLLEGGRN